MIAPVFPLPNVVFFPRTILPLHIFEPRYRRMIADAMAGDRRIVIVLAREERPPSAWPALHDIGCLGTIDLAQPREDGRFDIIVRGLVRVEIEDLDPRPADPSDPARYFAARLTARGEALPDLQDPRVADARTELLMLVRRYGERILEGRYPGEALTDATEYAGLVNQAASILRASVEEKQGLLALDDVGERAERVAASMREQLRAIVAVDAFGPRRPGDPRLN